MNIRFALLRTLRRPSGPSTGSGPAPSTGSGQAPARTASPPRLAAAAKTRGRLDFPTGSSPSRGVALVITMILLALITTLAVAFLALTHRETGAVDSMARTTDSELAAESGMGRAEAEIASVFRTGNEFTNGVEIIGPGLLVSVAQDTNQLSVNNSVFDLGPPVFVDTNRNGTTGPLEFRFYLDLNRNTNNEPTGYFEVIDNNGRAIPGSTNFVVGDPQWIGLLQNPLLPHSPSNRFIARYAFLIQPIGRSLDLNWIHNQVGVFDSLSSALDMNPATGVNGYFRNQGVGPWELNLAAFLADLNTNYWANYSYNPFNAVAASIAPSSAAFNDARELLRYRFMPQAFDLLSGPPSPHTYIERFQDLFPNLAPFIADDQVDGYGDGPLGPLVAGDPIPLDGDRSDRPWPGADSKRHYFSLHDFFDARKLPERQGNEFPTFGFRSKLQQASAQSSTYDRYSYYTMLAQLGTDAAEEEDDKVNINYVNIPSWVDGARYPLTNLWSDTSPEFISRMGRPGPELFLLTVATNLIAREPSLAFIATNAGRGIPLRIPIYTNGSTLTTNLPVPGPLYSGRVHQLLQMAANIHDATTGPKQGEVYPYFPSVFRPQFERMGNGEVYITNYVMVTETAANIMTNRVWHDLDLNEGLGNLGPNDGVYGIPLIIGARKGFPSFNEVGFITKGEVTRRLEMVRPKAGDEISRTNYGLIMRITNSIAVEAVNSYETNYSRQIDMFVGIRSRTLITNSTGLIPGLVSSNWVTGYYTSIVAQAWQGARLGSAAHYQASPVFHQPVMNITNSIPEVGGTTNRWGITVTNRVLFFLVDNASGRIVDAVALNGPRAHFDLGGEMVKPVTGRENRPIGQVWSARTHPSGTSFGVAIQIGAATNAGYTTQLEWDDFSDTAKSKGEAIDAFIGFLTTNRQELSMQVPLTPTRRIIQTNFFRVNDPLVHYTLEDLEVTDGTATIEQRAVSDVGTLTLGSPNPNSIPWNHGSSTASEPGQGALDPTIRDPGVTKPDYWEFPTNRFPSIGWLGRVHRGTPWQSIYLKSKPPTGNWVKHSGPSRWEQSALLMIPTRDWDLLDIFTTVHHPNATRGRLSINQTNVAAWSALLSGVLVSGVTNDSGFGGIRAVPEVVQPAALAPPLATIVEGINATREVRPGRQFQRFGQLLSVPELTFRSPFLNSADFNAEAPVGQARVFDSDYERIPQQILGLIKLGEPRFVIYAWGQSLKPARRNPEDTGPSIVTSGAERGLVRNYQITGEMATRAVVRVEFEPFPGGNTNAVLASGAFDYSRPHIVVEKFNVLPNE